MHLGLRQNLRWSNEIQWRVINFCHWKSHLKHFKSWICPPGVLKNILKIALKLNEMIELHIHYLYTKKSGSQFLPAICAKKHPRKSNISDKNTIDDLYFYLKVHSSQTPSTILTSKKVTTRFLHKQSVGMD